MGEQGQHVWIQYKGLLPDGTVFDDSGNNSYEIILGRGQVMKVLDEALMEMRIGDERTIEIAAKDAYGEYNEKAVQKVPTWKIPNGENMPVGQMIEWKTPRSERPIPAKVLSLEDQMATLDFNHPLAGKDIVYWVKLIDIDVT